MGIARQTLAVPEYGLKVASVPAGVITAGSAGNTLEKMVNGGKKVWSIPIDAVNNYQGLAEISNDYSSLITNEFAKKHGAQAVQYVLDHVQGIIDWGNQLAQNVSEQPIETAIAAGGITALLYGFGRTLKVIRQKGQGSYLTRLERKIGQKYWPKTKQVN